MKTIDDIIFYFQETTMLAKNGTISMEHLIERIEQGTEKLKETGSAIDLTARTASSRIQKLCKTDLTTELPPEVKEKRE